MKISVLGTGSKGNSTLIITKNETILIDAGLTFKYINEQLKKYNVNKIDKVILTHTHDDHTYALPQLIKKFNPIIMLSETMHSQIKNIFISENYFVIDKPFIIDNIHFTYVRLSHDSEEVFAYIIKEEDNEVVYITDTGYINARYHGMFQNKTFYIIESNYDVDMLMNGRYPHHLKRRILSDKGHLSNEDTCKYLSKYIGDKTLGIIFTHLSENNNSYERVIETANTILKDKLPKYVIVSSQTESTELINLD
jgi:phosphoribosyl 1,2-cyclic phosphodiesterase